MFEKQPGTRGRFDPLKHVKVSSNGGLNWTSAGRPGPMQWPTLFRTETGVYAMGVEHAFLGDRTNDVVIVKMLDEDGMRWTWPVKITHGLCVVTANGGMDLSGGFVTKVHRAGSLMNGLAGGPKSRFMLPLS